MDYEELLRAGKMHERDGWHVPDYFLSSFDIARQHKPPRPFGFVNQLAFDLRRPGIEWVMWLGSIVGVALGLYWDDMVTVVCGAFVGAYMVVAVWRATRKMRDAQLLVHRCDGVSGSIPDLTRSVVPGGLIMGSFAVDKVSGGGRTVVEAGVSHASLKYLSEKHKRFEVLLLVRPDDKNAACLGVRGVD